MCHRTRADVSAAEPVHVTVRVRSGVGNLRAPSRSRIVERALFRARERHGMRIVHWSIQGNHLHLIVEAIHRHALARGMQTFASVTARRLNRCFGRRGPVFVDRYHAHVLRTPRETRNAVRYVLCNVFLHAGVPRPSLGEHLDFLSSAFYADAPDDIRPAARARAWLLRQAAAG